MRLVLSAAEQSQLMDTSRVLLSPLDEPVDGWRANVLRHVAELLGAPMGGFILPTGDPPPYTLHNLPVEFAREYLGGFQAADRGVIQVQQLGGSVWNTRLLLSAAGRTADDWFASREYREFYGRFGIRDGVGFIVPPAEPPLVLVAEAGGPSLGAVLTCFSDVFGTDALGERGLQILRLLLPALEAGVAGRVRLGWLHNLLLDALDVVQDGLQLHDASGRRLHANAALADLLQRDPERDLIEQTMAEVLGALRAVLRAPAHTDPQSLRQAAGRELVTACARYRIRGQLVRSGEGGERLIVVSVARLTPVLPSLETLQERWRLTPQEARVALLLARGASNVELAAELKLRSSTARHYTEAVFLKLHVHSRAEAVRRILAE